MIKLRTKVQLKKSHDAMARFLVSLCRDSDERLIHRTDEAQRQYDRAQRLIRAAGLKYDKPPMSP